MDITRRPPYSGAPAPADASGARSDLELARLWLERHESPHTQRAYGADSTAFLAWLSGRGATLRTLTVRDLADWVATLIGAPNSRARRIAAVRSLLTFGERTGYLAFNVGAAIKAPTLPSHLAERILTEDEVRAILLATRPADAALVRFLYRSGTRISEAVALRWSEVHPAPNERGYILTIHGKGGKTRYVGVDPSTLPRDPKSASGYVFATRSGRPLHASNASHMVRRAALAAGIDRPVSPHWLRHSHASHALDHGAPISLVQANLGHSSLSTTGQYVHARPTDSSAYYLPK